MIARFDSSPGASSAIPDQRRPDAAIVIAGVGALLVGSAPLVGVVVPRTPAAFPSWPLLLALAALPPLLALAFRRRPALAASALLAPAALAPGRLLMDAQLMTDAGRAARPELLVPRDLAALEPSTGLWLLLAGHVAALTAGIVVLRQRLSDPATAAFAENPAGPRKRGLVVLVLCVTIAAAVGLCMPQFTSDDPFLLPRAALDSPLLVLAGCLLVALAVPSVGGYVVVSADPDFARGGLLGLSAATGAIVVPPLFAAASVAGLHYGPGAVVALGAALVLAVVAVPAGQAVRDESASEPRLPVLSHMLRLSGALALGAGLVALLAATIPHLEMPPGLRDPSAFPARMLLPAGVTLALLGAGLFVPRVAEWLRPVLSVSWVVVPMAVAAVLDAVFTATETAGFTPIQNLAPHAGPGPWVAGLALFLALFAAVATALAGGVERDDVDPAELALRRVVLGPAVVAALLGVAAFGLPVVTAPGYRPPGMLGEFDTTSWGLVIGMFAVLAACALAPRCRPQRGTALLCGAGLVVVQRGLEMPLTAARFEGSTAGPGLWAGLACLVMLLVAAALAARPTEG